MCISYVHSSVTFASAHDCADSHDFRDCTDFDSDHGSDVGEDKDSDVTVDDPDYYDYIPSDAAPDLGNCTQAVEERDMAEMSAWSRTCNEVTVAGSTRRSDETTCSSSTLDDSPYWQVISEREGATAQREEDDFYAWLACHADEFTLLCDANARHDCATQTETETGTCAALLLRVMMMGGCMRASDVMTLIFVVLLFALC